MSKQFIYHVAISNYWEKFSEEAVYTPPTFQEEGFIHCCTEDQIDYVLTTYFKGKSGILLLKINTALLTADLKIEPTNGQHFPHIYGTINKEAIVEIIAVGSRQ